MNRLQQLNRPVLFAGVIAGWETMIGQDFKTGEYLGFGRCSIEGSVASTRRRTWTSNGPMSSRSS